MANITEFEIANLETLKVLFKIRGVHHVDLILEFLSRITKWKNYI